jgi:vacuolar-type H+-ATPase subunit F/Vma7
VSYGVRVLCRPAVAAGFRLAGVTPTEAPDAGEGARLLRAMLDDAEYGVILVEEGIYAAVPDTTRGELARRPLPMVVPIPGPTWAVSARGPEAFIAELLRRAIGYRIKFG